MAHAQKCPICKGTGRMTYTEYYGPPNTTYDSFVTTINGSCRGCDGKGWVEVSDK